MRLSVRSCILVYMVNALLNVTGIMRAVVHNGCLPSFTRHHHHRISRRYCCTVFDSTMTNFHPDVEALWGEELRWIQNEKLREQTAKCWEIALSRSVMTVEDLNKIPFTLLAPTKVTFMTHKRAVVHMARDSAMQIKKFFPNDLPCDIDVTIAGAILCDVGKLLEYTKIKKPTGEEEIVTGLTGKYLRHPFLGVAIAMEVGLPDSVSHIIAAHAGEGDLMKRSVEAFIVHHNDFMTFKPFQDRLKV